MSKNLSNIAERLYSVLAEEFHYEIVKEYI